MDVTPVYPQRISCFNAQGKENVQSLASIRATRRRTRKGRARATLPRPVHMILSTNEEMSRLYVWEREGGRGSCREGKLAFSGELCVNEATECAIKATLVRYNPKQGR